MTKCDLTTGIESRKIGIEPTTHGDLTRKKYGNMRIVNVIASASSPDTHPNEGEIKAFHSHLSTLTGLWTRRSKVAAFPTSNSPPIQRRRSVDDGLVVDATLLHCTGGWDFTQKHGGFLPKNKWGLNRLTRVFFTDLSKKNGGFHRLERPKVCHLPSSNQQNYGMVSFPES